MIQLKEDWSRCLFENFGGILRDCIQQLLSSFFHRCTLRAHKTTPEVVQIPICPPLRTPFGGIFFKELELLALGMGEEMEKGSSGANVHIDKKDFVPSTDR